MSNCKIINRATVIARFRANCFGFWRKYRWLIAIFVVAALCDGLSTIYFMLRWGASAEVHPIIRLVSHIFGPILGPLLSVSVKAALGIALAIYLRRIAFYILLFSAGLSFWAAWYNFYGYSIYTPRILYWIPW